MRMFSYKGFIEQWLLSPGLRQKLTMTKARLKLVLKSADDKRLLAETKQCKDRHPGSRCFILGGGSSIKSQDIKQLEGEIVLSVSNTFVHPDFQRIKPHYHLVPSLIESHGEIHKKEEFISWLKEMESSTGDAEMFFHIGDRKMIEGNGLFKNRTIHWVEYTWWDGDFSTSIDLMRVPHVMSVSELAITVALHLGFDNIYLIGIDHDWFNGLHIYFYDHTKEHVMRPAKNDLSFVDSEFQMRRHAEIFKKYKYLYSVKRNIFNANSNHNHYLDVFPKVHFDSLFTEASTPVKDGKNGTN